MWRISFIPCLILGLLVCPLRCAVGAAFGAEFGGATTAAASSAAASPAGTSAGCPCCAPQAGPTKTGPASRVPVNSAPQDCGCSSCICAGAILPSDADGLSTASGDALEADGACGILWSLTAAAAEPVARASADSFSPPGQLLNGRAARIAHQSLLI